MNTKYYLLLFSGVDLVRQAGIGTVLASGWKLLGRAARAFVRLNEPVTIDERTLKDLGISRAQADFELSQMPWHHWGPY